jgi:transcriptional regulator with XRE-family HTH domain
VTTSGVFRQRLTLLIERSGQNQAGFARLTDIDRSTLSQLLQSETIRLPRAETLLSIARACNVSIDWLLGLSQREEVGAEIIEAVVKVEPHIRTPIDERFAGWLKEAEGYKVRTVPESFPDFMKTRELIHYEYAGGAIDYAAIEARLMLMRSPERDLEVCTSIQEITAMALGQGKWNGLPLGHRRSQLAHLVALSESLYPNLRIYLYTLTETYANPFTVFGPHRVALFLGTNYLVLNGPEHIRLFNRRFEDLIRHAVVQPHQFSGYVTELVEEIGG